MGNAGRPKGDNNKDYNYTFRMDLLTRIRLEKYCEKMQIQKSEAIRKAIDNMKWRGGNKKVTLLNCSIVDLPLYFE